MDTQHSESKRSTLGRFEPETRMRGHWIGWSALACCVAALAASQFVGAVLSLLLGILGVCLSIEGLRSRGRAISVVAFFFNAVVVMAFLLVLIGTTEVSAYVPTRTGFAKTSNGSLSGVVALEDLPFF
jgi:Ca2+/H+ antiporter